MSRPKEADHLLKDSGLLSGREAEEDYEGRSESCVAGRRFRG